MLPAGASKAEVSAAPTLPSPYLPIRSPSVHPGGSTPRPPGCLALPTAPLGRKNGCRNNCTGRPRRPVALVRFPRAGAGRSGGAAALAAAGRPHGGQAEPGCRASPRSCRWQRLRWRQTSHAEGVHVERRLLDLLSHGGYEQHDVKVGGRCLAAAHPTGRRVSCWCRDAWICFPHCRWAPASRTSSTP